MVRSLRILLIATTLMLITGATGYLVLTRANPVVARILPDGTIRSRYYCVLNPFRDKGPELVAVHYLEKLRAGHVQSISCCMRGRKDLLEQEMKWPIQSWRVGNRTDSSDSSELIYWVKRGNGYSANGYEEEVHFTILRSGNDWKLQSFSAVY